MTTQDFSTWAEYYSSILVIRSGSQKVASGHSISSMLGNPIDEGLLLFLQVLSLPLDFIEATDDVRPIIEAGEASAKTLHREP